MRIISSVLVAISFLFLNVKCKTDVVEVIEAPAHFIEATVQPYYGSDVLYLDSTFTTVQGYDIQFSELKFYLEDIKNDGAQIIDGALFDYRENGTFLFRSESDMISNGNLTSNLGVGPTVNHLDPSAFENSSVFNILNANDMHWDWNPGYIFLKIEARVDTIQDGTPLFNHNVVYHIGLDENLETIQFQNLNWTEVGGESQIALKLDLESFLNSPDIIDVKSESTSHSSAGQELLTTKVIQNFSMAISPN